PWPRSSVSPGFVPKARASSARAKRVGKSAPYEVAVAATMAPNTSPHTSARGSARRSAKRRMGRALSRGIRRLRPVELEEKLFEGRLAAEDALDARLRERREERLHRALHLA